MTTSDLFRGTEEQALYMRVLELETAVQQARLKRKRAQGPDYTGISNADRLRIFIDSNIVAIHRADVHGNVMELNDATVKLLGYAKEEFYCGAVTWKGITPPEYVHVDEAAIRQLKEKGTTDFLQKEYIRKDGSRVPVMLHITALDKEGLDCMVFVIDLTQSQKIENALKESEAQFRLLAEAIPQIVWMSYPSGRIKYANQRFYDFSGFEREEDDGFLWLNMLHPDDKSPLLSNAQKAYETNSPFNMEVRYRAFDGQYRWFLVRAIMIKDSSAKTLWFGTSTDIDEKKKIAEDLQESEARFSTLADAIPQIVFTADKNGDLDFFNQRWFEYTGLTKEQSEAHGWELLIHPDDLPRYLKGWHAAVSTGDSYETEFRLRPAIGTGKRTDKPYRWHLCRAVAWRDSDGSISKWFATWTEIERQKTSD